MLEDFHQVRGEGDAEAPAGLGPLHHFAPGLRAAHEQHALGPEDVGRRSLPAQRPQLRRPPPGRETERQHVGGTVGCRPYVAALMPVGSIRTSISQFRNRGPRTRGTSELSTLRSARPSWPSVNQYSFIALLRTGLRDAGSVGSAGDGESPHLAIVQNDLHGAAQLREGR